MQSILIVGIDTTVGGNLAAVFAEQFRVVGVSTKAPISVDGCEPATCTPQDVDSVRHCLAAIRPDWIIACGFAAVSTWESDAAEWSAEHELTAARNLAVAAAEIDCPLTMISTDAIFTGPWMFHDECSTSFCSSPEAHLVRRIEEATLQLAPTSLIVRTNAYGWSPQTSTAGWIEGVLADLEVGLAVSFDCFRHAAPILATDLAEILVEAQRARLRGVYHIAGGERTNPAQFVKCLAEQFDLPVPQHTTAASLSEPSSGFGCGETSLKMRKIREAVGFAPPTMREGLARLFEQDQAGFRERFQPATAAIAEKVA